MQRFVSGLSMLAWALWIGALGALFLFVTTLFHHNRELAVQTAPQLFLAYQRYHLILAVVALVSTVAWRVLVPSKMVVALFVLLAIAACCGVAVAIWIIGPMEQLRANGMSGGAEFRRLHGLSMMLYTGQVAMLLVSGIILPLAIGRAGARRSEGTGPASGSLA